MKEYGNKENDNIKAIIMAGGMGSRLMPLTQKLPKPLMPVLARPVINYTIELLRAYGIFDMGITLMHMPSMIMDSINKDFSGVINYFIEEKPLGTAGSVASVGDWLDNNPFLVISGDALTNIDLRQFYIAHIESNADITMAVTETDNPSLYGVVQTDKQGYVKNFYEKPKENIVDGNLINCGIYIINPAVLKQIPRNEPCDFARDLFPLIMRKGHQIFTYKINRYWCDIGCIPEYYKANMDMLKGVKGLDFFTVARSGLHLQPLRKVFIGENTFIGLKVEIGDNVIIGNNCYIDGNISLSNCVIANNTFLNTSCHHCITTAEHYIPIQSHQPIFTPNIISNKEASAGI